MWTHPDEPLLWSMFKHIILNMILTCGPVICMYTVRYAYIFQSIFDEMENFKFLTFLFLNFLLVKHSFVDLNVVLSFQYVQLYRLPVRFFFYLCVIFINSLLNFYSFFTLPENLLAVFRIRFFFLRIRIELFS